MRIETRTRVAIAVLGFTGLVGGTGIRRPLNGQVPSFRTSTEAVYVVATVTDRDGRLVTDLNETEFEVHDNDTVRPVVVFSRDRIPFAITIMVDVSGSLRDQIGLIRAATQEFVGHFEPGDRANIGTFAALPVVGPYFTASNRTLQDWFSSSLGGTGVPCWVPAGKYVRQRLTIPSFGSAVWDAVACGIGVVYADGETPRRVVMIVTDGKDNVSDNDRLQVQEEAIRKDIMVYAVAVRGIGGLDSQALRALAEQTGGGYFELQSAQDLGSTFSRIAEELRCQYVFGFTPASSAGPTHKLVVRPLRPGLTARARQVYVMPAVTVGVGDQNPGAPARASDGPGFVTGSKSTATVLAERLGRYERGTSVVPSMRREELFGGAKEFRRDAAAWINAGGSKHAPRRRLVVAAYVVDLLKEVHEKSLWGPSQSASVLLDWASTTLTQDVPGPGEHAWRIAALALLEKSAPVDALRRHLQEAEARFPDDHRWALVRTVADDVERAFERVSGGEVSKPLAFRSEQHFRQAVAHESIRQEALIRWGAYESEMGRQQEALARFEDAGNPDDSVLRYWLGLLKGRAYERADQDIQAIDAYRSAVAEFPSAQSGLLALAATLFRQRRAIEGSTIVNGMLGQRGNSLEPDPWDLYRAPDLRHWQQTMAQLRRAIAQ